MGRPAVSQHARMVHPPPDSAAATSQPPTGMRALSLRRYLEVHADAERRAALLSPDEQGRAVDAGHADRAMSQGPIVWRWRRHVTKRTLT
jgi:hypothetical protein